MPQEIDRDVLPCGCLLMRVINDEGVKELQIRPCKMDCENLKTTLEMSVEEGKPIEYRTK